MRRALATMLLVMTVGLGLPAHAGAATQAWASDAETCGGHDSGERGSGQLDRNGFLYMPCSRSVEFGYDNHIGVFDPAGHKVARIDLNFDRDGHNWRAWDVAPSPDGSFLYVIRTSDNTVYRFVRQAGGAYLADSQAVWKLKDFPGDGDPCAAACRPRGQFLATDGSGYLYVSSGLWTCIVRDENCTDDAIVKYDANGNYVTRFGNNVRGSWRLGESDGAFGGVAVTNDGRRVFVTDINNSRVQRFDLEGGTYVARREMGRSSATPGDRNSGDCYVTAGSPLEGVPNAPYDVALTPGGEVMVINTTCIAGSAWQGIPYGTVEVMRYTQDGAFRGSITSKSFADNKVHGISVDRSGNVHLVQAKSIVHVPAGWSDAGAGGGGPMGGDATIDAVAPTITTFSAPATTTGRTVNVVLAATDNVGVVDMRLRIDGALQPWIGFSPGFVHTLADRLGSHALAVQVRDMSGNESAERTITIRRDATPGPVAPAPKPNPTPAPNPTPIVGGGGPALVPGAGDRVRPVITRMRMPVQVAKGRAVRVSVSARDNVGVTRVRFSSGNGRWGAWQSLRGARPVLVPAGRGWRGVLAQVGDAAGNRSTPWFQPVFMAPRGAKWFKGTSRADRVRLGAGTQHADFSNFDRKVDRISCGAGYDTVLVQPEDVVARNCERVSRFRSPVW